MAINTLISTGDTIKISKSFGIVGSAVVGRSKTPIIVVAANNNDPVTAREISINRPIVKMIAALASIDGFLKQRLQNQKIIDKNNQLARRESQIEQQDSAPQVEVIKPDAEKVDGSSAGLMTVGALLLLTLDPVQKAIGDIADGVISMGRFVTGIAKTLNDVFKFFVGGNNETVSGAVPEPTAGGETPPQPTPTDQSAGSMATPVESESTPSQVQPEKKPSFLSSVASGALTGATVGSFIPRVGGAVGAVVGGVGGAISYFTGGNSSSQSAPQATQTSASSPTSNSSPAPTATDASKTAPSGEMPKNDIVALGKYLQGQGIQVSENPAFGGVDPDAHSKNSRHYKGQAIDLNIVSGDDSQNPQAAAKFDALKPQLEAAGYNVLWRVKDHFDHMHVSVGGPEGSGGGAYGDSSSG